ncbi:MAG: GNAT family N-acetyltransferase [Patescibacteria group bacterium]
MKTHTIREYTQEDVTNLEDLLVELQQFEQFIDSDRLEGLEMAKDYLDELLSKTAKQKGKLFVVEIDEGIVGMIVIYIEKNYRTPLVDIENYVFISDLILLPEFRQEHIAKDLLEKAHEFAKEHGLKTIMARVFMNHKELQPVYHRHGFKDYEVLVKKSD